jgi:branched-chain amino acid transport system permease protein
MADPGRPLKIVPSLCVLALALVPLFTPEFYHELLTKVMIMSIFAMSLDLLVGFTGLVSFGHAAFFAIAAYALVAVAPQYDPVSLWWSLPVAMAASALAALIIGVFVLRTRGIYFIMVTLAFAQTVYFVFHDTPVGGGSDGVYLYFKPTTRIAGVDLASLDDTSHFYYLVLVAMIAVYLFLRRVLRSPFGHALVGIKVNEHRMRSLGYPVFYYKLASFTLAGGLAGLAGYLSAVQYGFVNPEIASWHESGNVLLMVILGGLGTLHGAVAGAFAFVLLEEVFAAMTRHWQLLMGAMIVALVLFLPGGLSSTARRLRRGPGPDSAPADGEGR